MDYSKTLKCIKALIISTTIASIWAILEHFGHSFSCLIFPDFKTFDTSCWVQDVKERVFATLGQPNWLAAWIDASIFFPVFLFLTRIYSKKKGVYPKIQIILPACLFFLFFLSLLFTKSKSGILGFAVPWFLFWTATYLIFGRKVASTKTSLSDFIKTLVLFNTLILFTTFLFGKFLLDLVPERYLYYLTGKQEVGTFIPGVLKNQGGTESGVIRLNVWKTSIEIWKNYPILGSGVETFAYTFFFFKPKEHNLTSEWDFVFNKAHNEYLNYLANTGLLGFSSYLILVSFFLRQTFAFFFPVFKKEKLQVKETEKFFLSLAIFSGYLSILITNFFGFSTVSTSLLFFLLPAMALTLEKKKKSFELKHEKFGLIQKLIFVLLSVLITLTIIAIIKYFLADLSYAQGKAYNNSGAFDLAEASLEKAIRMSPNEPNFYDELSKTYTNLAINYFLDDSPLSYSYLEKGLSYSQKAIELSPANPIFKRTYSQRLLRLSNFDKSFTPKAKKVLEELTHITPTDPKNFYNLAALALNSNDYDKAISLMSKAIELKPNYKEAHLGLATIYAQMKENQKAKEELLFILDQIDPDYTEAKKMLEELEP